VAKEREIMSLTLEEALRIAKEKEGYERCFNPEHGLGEMCTHNGVTAPANFIICPIFQFYPKPTYLFHSEAEFIASCEILYKERGWIE
jgi:hypothetical protein